MKSGTGRKKGKEIVMVAGYNSSPKKEEIEQKCKEAGQLEITKALYEVASNAGLLFVTLLSSATCVLCAALLSKDVLVSAIFCGLASLGGIALLMIWFTFLDAREAYIELRKNKQEQP